MINIRNDASKRYQDTISFMKMAGSFDDAVKFAKHQNNALLVGGRIYRAMITAKHRDYYPAVDYDFYGLNGVNHFITDIWARAKKPKSQKTWIGIDWAPGVTEAVMVEPYSYDSAKFICEKWNITADCISPRDICGKSWRSMSQETKILKYFEKVPLTIQQVAYDTVTGDLWTTEEALRSIEDKKLYWNNENNVPKDYADIKLKSMPPGWTVGQYISVFY